MGQTKKLAVWRRVWHTNEGFVFRRVFAYMHMVMLTKTAGTSDDVFI